MALTHVVDTSVVTRLANPAVRAKVEPLALRGEIGRLSITDLEVGYSARDASEWHDLVTALDIFAPLETTGDHVKRALQVQRLLASRHQRGRKIPDLLVAAGAEQASLVVLHYDADFDRIAAITGQPCEWILPAGTVN